MDYKSKLLCTIGAAFGIASCASKPPAQSMNTCNVDSQRIEVTANAGHGELISSQRLNTRDIDLASGATTLFGQIDRVENTAINHNGLTTLQNSERPQTGDTLQAVIDPSGKIASCALVSADGEVRTTFTPGKFSPY